MKRAAASLSALGVLLAAATASAATCPARPTDAGGYLGYAYGTDEAKSFDGTKVRVHYTTTGSNAVVATSARPDLVPDSVALTAEVGDAALTKYAELGFRAPVSDVDCDSNGGDAKLDIYLVKFAAADGTTVRASCTGLTCSTFVLSEATFVGRGYPTPAEGFRTVIAHELFHAVQIAYSADLEGFWSEGTAQWGMRQVYPDLVDFDRQLPAFFKENKRSMDAPPAGASAGFLYGAAVWPLFLTIRHGKDTVRTILEGQVGGASAITATGKVLAGLGSSLAASLPLFGAWNAATKSLAAPDGYPDAAKYPGLTIDPLTDGASAITSGFPYYAYRGTLDTRSLVSLETDAARNAGVVVRFENGKPLLATAKALPANAEGEVLVVVAGITEKKTDAPFTVRLGAADPALDAPDGGSTDPDGGAGSPGGNDADDGGCAVAGPPGRPGNTAPLAGLGLVLAGLACVRARARARRR